MAESYSPIIYLAYANDRVDPGRYLRNLVSEIRTIRKELDREIVPPYRIIISPNATFEDIIEVFDQYESQIHVFHFAGHANDLQLLLETDDGKTAYAGIEGFTRFLSIQANLKLVFLNGCSTEAHARALVSAGVPAVVATYSMISDEVAMAFAERFYQRLAQHKSVAQAFEAAEIKVQTLFMEGGQFRTLHFPDETQDIFPWGLFGPLIRWRLHLNPKGAKGTMIPLLCDRDKQVEVFRDSLESVLADTDHLPQFYTIHGRRAERHRSLVQRFKEVEIRYNSERLFGLELGVVHYFEVRDWPYTGDLEMRKRNLKRSVARAADLPGIIGPDWQARAMVEFQQLRGGTVIFQHTILGEKWDSIAIKLLEWYVKEFWNITIEKELPQFIIFLNIIYPDRPPSILSNLLGISNRKQKIQQKLYEIAERSGKRFKVLRELRPIPYADVVDWVEEFFPEELGELPDVIYGNNIRKRLSMEVIERNLKKEVQRLDREQSQRELFGE